MSSHAVVELKFPDDRGGLKEAAGHSSVVVRAQKRVDEKIAIIGLGYVGFPLSMELADAYEDVLGFDISAHRVSNLRKGIDQTGEIPSDRVLSSQLRLCNQASELADSTFFIVTVPTPIDDAKKPDLSPLKSACETIGRYVKRGDIVVFESTVYPGVTEDFCAPILEAESGLRSGEDFNIGYSPERINPGDKNRPITKIVKNVSADSEDALNRVANVYESIIAAGVHRCPSIKVAEASKVIENTQRDVNIALMNELSVICDHLDINSRDVIKAAATKWNFVPYTPGLVGGHCIGVDPYYLSSLSESLGHNPELILASRRVNEGVAAHVAKATIKKLISNGAQVQDARIGVFGMTFKEDVPDTRNSKSVDIVKELENFGVKVMIHDPIVEPAAARAENMAFATSEELVDLDAMVVAVGHAAYKNDSEFLERLAPNGALIDVKSSFAASDLKPGQTYWSL